MKKTKKPFLIGEKQEQAAALLWEGYSLQETADKVGVHRTTLWRWYKHREMVTYTRQVFRKGRAKLWRETAARAREEGREMRRKIKENEYNNYYATYRETDRWLRQNHCPDNERREILRSITERHKAQGKKLQHKRP